MERAPYQTTASTAGRVLRLRERKRRRIVAAILNSVFGAAVVATAFVYVMRLPALAVANVMISGNAVTQTADILSAVESASRGSYGHLIPHENVLVYPADTVAAAVLAVSPRIKSAAVSVSDGVAYVGVAERAVRALWCADEGDTTCYLMDETGYVFAEAPAIEGNTLVRYHGGIALASGTTPVAQRFLEAESSFLEIGYLLNELAAIDVAPAAVYVDPVASVSVRTKSGTLFHIGRRDDFVRSIERIKLLLDDPSVPIAELYASGELESLDVRFTSKALYKVRGVASQGISETVGE